jgi:cytochrome P450
VEGEKWRQLRNKLSPTFTSGKMKGMFPLVEDCAANFEGYIRQHQGENADIKVSYLDIFLKLFSIMFSEVQRTQSTYFFTL